MDFPWIFPGLSLDFPQSFLFFPNTRSAVHDDPRPLCIVHAWLAWRPQRDVNVLWTPAVEVQNPKKQWKSKENLGKAQESWRKIQGKPRKTHRKPGKIDGKPRKIKGKPGKIEGKPRKIEGKPRKFAGKPKKIKGKPRKIAPVSA